FSYFLAGPAFSTYAGAPPPAQLLSASAPRNGSRLPLATALFTMVSRSTAAGALCVAAARRPTRTSAWQNTPPASSVPVRGALARVGSRGGRRRRVLVRPLHAEFYRRLASRPRCTARGGGLT